MRTYGTQRYNKEKEFYGDSSDESYKDEYSPVASMVPSSAASSSPKKKKGKGPLQVKNPRAPPLPLCVQIRIL
jgi:hypothetical protein